MFMLPLPRLACSPSLERQKVAAARHELIPRVRFISQQISALIGEKQQLQKAKERLLHIKKYACDVLFSFSLFCWGGEGLRVLMLISSGGLGEA
jgi:hypothetical protein